MKKLILIDSHAIIHRAYHALPLLTSPQGEATQAAYGFSSILLRILRDLKPDYIAAAFDMPGPTFRHLAYERYKAQRPETPSDLASQFSLVKKILEAFEIPVLEEAGYEADDIIGTVAEKVKNKNNLETIVVTGDADILQLIRPHLKVYSMKKGISDIAMYGRKEVEEKYGFGPEKITDFKGLKGDPSDNIPGVKGIGEKTAQELIKEFSSLEKIYQALSKKNKKISASVAKKLSEGKDIAFTSRDLATIKRDVPFPFSLENARWTGNFPEKNVRELFVNLGFESLNKRLFSSLTELPAKQKENNLSEQKTKILEAGNDEKIKAAGNSALVWLDEKIYLISENSPEIYRLDKKYIKENAKLLKDKSFYSYHAKELFRFLAEEKIEFPEIKFDIGVASSLVYGANSDSLGALIMRELEKDNSGEALSKLKFFFETARSLEKKIASQGLTKIYYKMENPLIAILAKMEYLGIKIERRYLKTLTDKISKELKSLTTEIFALAGENFNINSTRELSHILFEKIGINTAGMKKTEKGGVISTRESELNKIEKKHMIVPLILKYRELAKLKTTYADILPELADSAGRVHTRFNQIGAATGRLSSSNPNLQNIPVSSEYGREIRKAFVADKNFCLLSLDYSQIELRIAAHLARDKKMIAAFKSGMDIHRMTASEVYNVSLEEVTAEQRRGAKTLNFGVLYGMGPQAFSETTGMTKLEAKKFIDEYFHDFSGVKKFMEKIKNQAYEKGYVETMLGRRRYIPELQSGNWQLKRSAERMAINMPIQGSAADLVKLAMVEINEFIKENEGVRLLLQVHDELVFETTENLIYKLTPRLKSIMENVLKLDVPLVVDAKVGMDWGDMKSLKL